MVFVIMPSPVMGAALLYTVCFMAIVNNRSEAAEIISGSIIDEINRFVGTESQFDDISLLIEKRIGLHA